MKSQDSYTTIKIWNRSKRNLLRIRAETGEKMVEILDRVLESELKKVLPEKENYVEQYRDGES